MALMTFIISESEIFTGRLIFRGSITKSEHTSLQQKVKELVQRHYEVNSESIKVEYYGTSCHGNKTLVKMYLLGRRRNPPVGER